jgi:hypothetical protein
VEQCLEDQETPVRERLSESEGLGSLDPSGEASSLGQPCEIPEPALCEPEPTLEKVTQPSSQQPSSGETNELKNMLAAMFAMMQETVRKDLAANNESIKADINSVKENQESVKADISNVRADLAANNERVRADLAASQESVRKELNKIRKDLKSENESLVKRFETHINKQRKN